MFADRLKNLREQKGLTQQQMLDEIIEALSKEAQDEKDVKLSLSTYDTERARQTIGSLDSSRFAMGDRKK